jgi:acetyl esterase/lipase
MDPELVAAVPLIPDLPFDDLERTRRAIDKMVASAPADLSGVSVADREIPRGDGTVPVRIFEPEEIGGYRPAVLSLHGGGFAVGSMALDDDANAAIARAVGAVVVSVEYRLAPEHPFPAAADDCYAALVWLSEGGEELRLDRTRVAVLGSSAGGGLAATTALLARDRGGPPIAMQALLEPELDDRLDTHSMRHGTETVGWSYANAVLSWRYYLGDVDPPPLHAAPARTDDLSGLPPAYIAVSELDCLRDEGLEFASRLMAAGVPTELHCWPGVFHGFQTAVPGAAVSRRADASLHRALRRALVDVAPDASGARTAQAGPPEVMCA